MMNKIAANSMIVLIANAVDIVCYLFLLYFHCFIVPILICSDFSAIVIPFIDRFGQPDELLPIIRPYYLVILASIVFVALFNAMRQFADSLLRPSVGMWILISGNAVNIVFNYLLIYGKCGFPEMGLLGAGIATLIARLSMAVAHTAVVLGSRRYKPYVKAFAESRLSLAAMRTIFATSIPIAVQMALETGSFTAASVMIGWLGKVPLAAYQIMVIFGMLGFMIYYSLGASITIKSPMMLGLPKIE